MARGVHSGFNRATLVLPGGGEIRFDESTPAARSNYLHVAQARAHRSSASKDARHADWLVLELGLHRSPTAMDHIDLIASLRSANSSARVIWMVTPPQSFQSPNGTGAYDTAHLAQLQAQMRSKGRVQNNDVCAVKVPDRQSKDEFAALRDLIADASAPLYGVLHLQGINGQGDAKIGGGVGSFGDCSHYCMPGVPDVLARSLAAMMNT